MKICVLISLASMLFFGFLTPILARPSKEEKSIRRAEFWGLYSDLYRALNCLQMAPNDKFCAQSALANAIKHAVKIEELIGENFKSSNKFVDLNLKLLELPARDSFIIINSIMKNLSSEFTSNIAPIVQPSYKKGKEIYDLYCTSCHGEGLENSGSLSNRLKYKPTSFAADGRGKVLTAFGVYSVVIHGIENSEMTSMLDMLDVDEIWAVAFYIASLTHANNSNKIPSGVEERISKNRLTFALSNLAVSTDEEIKGLLNDVDVKCGECRDELAFIRKSWSWNGNATRLGVIAQTPVQAKEYRALSLLLISVVAVSLGFYFTLRRRSRIK